MLKKTGYLLSLLLLVTICRSQDLHFSQFNSAPLNINPALTGLFDANMRVVLNHRNQWQSVTVPFLTSSVSFDMNLEPASESDDVIGIGLVCNRDKAGDSEFGTIQGNLSLSYTKHVGDKLFITYGMQAGMAQRSINYQNLTFDSQFIGDQFHPHASTWENFTDDNFTFFDASAGLNVFKEISESKNLNLGAALYHLNTPDQSLKKGYFPLYRRLGIHGHSDIGLSSKISLLPGFLYLAQGPNYQLNFGSYVRYRITKRDETVRRAFYTGCWMRVKDRDALILSARFDYNKLNVGLSYDINFSKLTAASNHRGGLELSVLLLIDRQKASPPTKNIPCPIFM
jgi:type IX secretion system PorP/SprF family membrane protein